MCNFVDCTHVYSCIHCIKKEKGADYNNNMKVFFDILRREFVIFAIFLGFYAAESKSGVEVFGFRIFINYVDLNLKIIHFGFNISNLANLKIFN